jgi:double-stranded uracil-DNA glycosylase
MRRPTRAELTAAAGGHVPDVIGPQLDVLFCGINPSLYSAATGLHFARPGNRFWPSLHAAGFTEQRLSPVQWAQLLECGCGITNFVDRATASAAELSAVELARGAEALEEKVRRFQPKMLAVLGIAAYRSAFGRGEARPGPQLHQLAGVPVWLLPNPSGLNAHYSAADLAQLFAQLRRAVAPAR